MKTWISPSILSADLANLHAELQRLSQAGADMVHIDVMDGCFVDNLTYGVPVVAAMRHHCDLPFDVHLMVQTPQKLLERFMDAGADLVTFHLESDCDPSKMITSIVRRGKKPAVAIKPDTPVQSVFPYLEDLYMVLIMTVEPGFGGQAFLPHTLGKVQQLREELNRRGLSVHIQVDGGINAQTADAVRRAGADILVAGSYVFGAPDMRLAVESLRR